MWHHQIDVETIVLASIQRWYNVTIMWIYLRQGPVKPLIYAYPATPMHSRTFCQSAVTITEMVFLLQYHSDH